jgi:hypothetical protein
VVSWKLEILEDEWMCRGQPKLRSRKRNVLVPIIVSVSAVDIEGVFDMTGVPAVHQAGMNTASELAAQAPDAWAAPDVVDLFGDDVRESLQQSGHELGTLSHRGSMALVDLPYLTTAAHAVGLMYRTELAKAGTKNALVLASGM